MSTPLMPELPEPPEHDEVITNSYGSGHSDYQLQQYAHAYGLAVWKAAMEQAARTCTEWGGARLPARGGDALRNCADAIRSLPLPEQGSPQ